jgi:ornithine cyclodeaminase/alanine dehydrogenase
MPYAGPRYLTASNLQGLGLTIGRVADVIEDAFRHKAAGRAVMPTMTFFHRERAQWFNSMVCWIPPLAYAGCKFQSGDSTNPARGLPSIQGFYILCESEGGRMVALMDARWLTAIRTAAVGALFARIAAPAAATTLGILGCGLQGRLQLEAMKSMVPGIVHCRAYDTVPAHAAQYAKEMHGRFGVDVEIVPSAEAAVRGADIVMSSGPIMKVRNPPIQPDWFAPGCMYLSLDRDSYISDAAVGRMDIVLSDDREALQHARAHEGGFEAVAHVDADLTDIAAGMPVKRRDPSQRVAVFVNGLGIEDLAAASEIFRLATEKQAGTVLPAEWS